ncbi:MAG: OmpA family protein [Prolixibacteraceae bacterium]|nr:OmpA family protein [Prolixibacteraceae bacterium]
MKRLILFSIVYLLVFSGYSQTSDKKWAIGLGAGMYNNMFKEYSGLTPEVYLSRYLNPSFDLMLKDELGFKDQGAEGSMDFNNILLNLRYKLANNYLLSEDSKIKPYIFGGVGYLQDNMDNGVNFDAGIGTKFALSPGAALYIEGGYINGITTDLVKTSAGEDRSDDFWKVTGGLEFAFGKAKDQDMDGVPDKKDKCPDTPAGVAVDENGCPLDRDGDGVPDYKDDCPDTPGVVELNGCPDRDGDGVADKDDACPDVPGLKKFKGCPDTDEDGVPDPQDKCPDTPKGCPVDADGCPLDSDGDGVIDCQDDCPSVAGLVDNKGCPAAWEELELGPIYFDFDKSVIRPDAAVILDKVADALMSSAEFDFVVSGHTCSIGTDEYNQGLSERRAQAVVKYLMSKGVNNAFIGSHGYGETQPAVPNTTVANKQKNRRAEFKISIRKKM